MNRRQRKKQMKQIRPGQVLSRGEIEQLLKDPRSMLPEHRFRILLADRLRIHLKTHKIHPSAFGQIVGLSVIQLKRMLRRPLRFDDEEWSRIEKWLDSEMQRLLKD